MHQLYTVSRHDISAFDQLSLNYNFEAMPFFELEGSYSFSDSKKLLQELFPEGISKHGERYLLERYEYRNDGRQDYMSHLLAMELILELVRQWQFPDLPSRFSSTFAWEMLEEAEHFRNSTCLGHGNIYLVETETYIKRDMSLLLTGYSAVGNILLASKYWAGESSKEPVWECLLQAPVRVLDKITATTV